MDTTYFGHMESKLGVLTIAASDAGVHGVYFEQHRHFAGTSGWSLYEQHPQIEATRRQLAEYFEGKRQQFDLSLAPRGTKFQQSVWDALLRIDFGVRQTYGQLATALGKASAARAVGAAVGRNPLSIIVPCHRVLGGTGDLTGYAGGLERKKYLLELESKKARGSLI